MIRKVVTIAGLMALAASTLPADFSYQQTSTITGGMMAGMMKVAGAFSKQAREPVRATVAVKGDMMVNRTETSATLIDLAGQTITTIDLQKKTYSVMTFDEMKRMLEQASQKMQKGNPQAEMKFKVSATNTGATKQIAGFEAKELVLKMEMESTDKQSGQTGSMVITTDSWIAPNVPGYNEVRDFHRRMAEKLNWTPGGNMFMGRPDMAQGMAEVAKELAKLDGVPVLQIVSMGGPPGAPGEATAQPQQQPAERPSIGGALGGALGRFGGLGKKKNPPPEEPAAAPPPSSSPGSLMEMTTELTGFSSSPVDASQFTVPPGFKKVEPK
jgi:hypothetical protein